MALLSGFSKVVLASSVALGLAATPIQAQDLFDWSGPYAGAHIGYGQGTVEGSYSDTEANFAATTEDLIRFYFGTDPPLEEDDPSWVDYVLSVYALLENDDVLTFAPGGDIAGAFGGAHAGYNWQSGSAVYGVDASLSLSGIGGEASFSNVYSAPQNDPVYIDGQFDVNLNWLAMLRGKAGFATGNFLPYVAAGLAVGQADISGMVAITSANAGKFPEGSSSTVQLGATAAIGTEIALTDDISWFGEYGYVAFLPFEVEVGDGAVFDFNLSSHLVRTGINISF